MSDDRLPNGTGDGSAETGPLAGQRAPVTPAIGDVFDLLADDVRRAVCLHLVETDREVLDITDIADAVAAEDRERLSVDLHHRHLPKLAAAGIIDYDPRNNTVRYWGQPTVEKWARHVRAVEERDGADR